MHFSTACIAAVAVLPALVAGHGNGGPKIFGRRTVAELKARSVFGHVHARGAGNEIDHDPSHIAKREEKVKRQNTSGQCGAGYGSCAAGYCCSPAGWCGNTIDYCYSPGCQYAYGPACPENSTPAGTNTSTIARTLVGSVAYGGAGVYDCVTPGTVAITYDDGPYLYTSKILDVLASYGAKATFFITGNNMGKGEIDIAANGYVPIIQRMHTDGHQIASHTWTHLDLSAISQADRKQQMWKNEMALRNILGFIPTYMRPPYSSCTSASNCESDMKTLGYHVTYFDVDTDDYNQDSTTLIQNSKNWFVGNITAGGATAATSDWLVIGHDIHYQTAYNLTDYMLSTLTTLGYKAVTVGECLGDPAANWYRTDPGYTSSSTTSASSTASSTVRTSSTSTVKTTSTTSTTTVKSSSSSSATSSTVKSSSSSSATSSTVKSSSSSSATSFTVKSSSSSSLSSSFSSSSSSSFTTTTTTTTTITTVKTSSTPSSTLKTSTTSTSSAKSSNTSSKPSSASSSTSSAPAASSSVRVSPDASCGGTNGYTCLGSTFGNCCSTHGWCGSTSAYCGTGCQSAFGTCGISTVSSATASAPTASATTVSTDGSCGGTNGFTCSGSTFGNCCSQYGWW
ncbi:carbohydrate esterase family 4 protein [Lepidopterella palustris CBS 459.81]|uniref:Carbohydrate esterase family 4 protein n=1 Tax=Lepidopterella palustris CBS 459.81 TaxID=1314670 RepID=A0A8E2EH26_9PEZI|nr:carbohydrate esterase family 4 protein [Lepidopterella palustris CBS 459.81]